MLNVKDAIFAVMDTETTGLSHRRDKAIQIGVVWCDWTGTPIQTYESFIHPEGTPISPGAAAINHLTDDMLVDAPFYEDVMQAIALQPMFDVMVGHNVAFDLPFVPDFKPTGTHEICTMQLSRKLWPDVSHKLQFLREHLGINIPDCPAHSALPDALVTAALLGKLLEHMMSFHPEEPLYVEEIVGWLK